MEIDIKECHSCGRRFTSKSEGACTTRLARDVGKEYWFCGLNCKDWHCDYRLINNEIVYNPSYREQETKKATKETKTGFLVQCANCNKEFNSKGLRCCSKACEAQLKLRFKRIGIGRYEDLPTKLYKNLELLEKGSKDLPTMITKELIAI